MFLHGYSAECFQFSVNRLGGYYACLYKDWFRDRVAKCILVSPNQISLGNLGIVYNVVSRVIDGADTKC
jgi:hypothetical protein